MTLRGYARWQYPLDRFMCACKDYEAAHPEIYGQAFSPQGEDGYGWGKWWMWRAFDRLVSNSGTASLRPDGGEEGQA